ncbi:GntR family transcriptional regulator [Lysinibacillus sp. G4S2]|uniref:GntR family transcriptional regulator n=1 Tax=Lysinibacillus sp. G4S2 TaxID=3055859 RepID=UPI0025A10378|nr:GntR family transcriptional regulator [Lysinibacillus sp. G4S2]MDM5247248.1 GntR family transcriptional regulator [Lysinibacillus sp. G4S2]
MNVKIDSRSKISFYQQLAQQLLVEIAIGNLQNGDQLPSIRDLAAETNLNLHTVHKSYKELQKKRIIAIKPQSKTFVVIEKSAKAKGVNLQQISMKVEQIMCEAFVLGISEHQLQQMFHDNMRKYYIER